MSLLFAVLFVGVFTYAITRWVYRLWLRSETRKAEAQRQRFNRIMQANQPPAAPGYPHRRVG